MNIKTFKELWLDTYWNWNSPLRRIIRTPYNWYREVKWFIQRGRRGWADCDVWNWDSYLADVIAGGTRNLANNHTGHPEGMTNAEWQQRLQDIASTFERYNQLDDIDTNEFIMIQKEYGVYQKWVPYKEKEGLIELKEVNRTPAYDREVNAHFKRSEQRYKENNKKMRQIFDVWGNLWD